MSDPMERDNHPTWASWLAEVFKPRKGVKRAEQIKAVTDEIERALGEVAEVRVPSARIAIETIEIYGLAIGVDANGRAAWIREIDGEYLEAVTG